MVTPVARFASGHRKIHKQDLRNLDIKSRKLARAIVGPPGGSYWSAPWHDIPHEWNAGVKLWSRRCLEQLWKLASYMADLPGNLWLKRAPAWTAGRRTKIGRPTNTWDAQIHNVLPMAEILENGGQPQKANRFFADTHGIDAEVMRGEIIFFFLTPFISRWLKFCCFPAP